MTPEPSCQRCSAASASPHARECTWHQPVFSLPKTAWCQMVPMCHYVVHSPLMIGRRILTFCMIISRVSCSTHVCSTLWDTVYFCCFLCNISHPQLLTEELWCRKWTCETCCKNSDGSLLTWWMIKAENRKNSMFRLERAHLLDWNAQVSVWKLTDDDAWQTQHCYSCMLVFFFFAFSLCAWLTYTIACRHLPGSDTQPK